jgi:hypothetical protein
MGVGLGGADGLAAAGQAQKQKDGSDNLHGSLSMESAEEMPV